MRWRTPASCPPMRRASIRERGAFDIARIDEIEQTTQHDVIAFTTAVAEHVGPAARWLHFGLTSSDVVDTAHALQMRDACDLMLEDSTRSMDAVRDARRRAPPHADDRPHARRPRRADDVRPQARALVRRDAARPRPRPARARQSSRVGKISGAVGTFAHLDPAIEAAVCARLGFEAGARSRRRSFSAIVTRSL